MKFYPYYSIRFTCTDLYEINIIIGAVHGDDQFYMYYPYMMSTLTSVDDESKKMIDIFTKMLTDFAKTG